MAFFKTYSKDLIDAVGASALTSDSNEVLMIEDKVVRILDKNGNAFFRAELKEVPSQPKLLEIVNVSEKIDDTWREDLRFAFKRAHEVLSQLGVDFVLLNNKTGEIRLS